LGVDAVHHSETFCPFGSGRGGQILRGRIKRSEGGVVFHLLQIHAGRYLLVVSAAGCLETGRAVLWTPGGVSEPSSNAGNSSGHGGPLSDLPGQEPKLTSILESLDPCGRIREAYWPVSCLSIGKTVFSSDYEA
jgi:hypothetical protein